LLKNYLKI